ncbi:MAG: dimethyl sulfoxide reductase anchor subunit family protein [Betaproteobacteria bacterium]
MKPALSLVIFTVGSGAGLGVMVWIVIARLLGVAPEGAALLSGFGLALGLLAIGLISSSLHLANRRNAWRAFAGWRHSWLAREAIAALLIWPVSAVWLYAVWTGMNRLESFAGLLLLVLAFLTVWCTAMIYACLRTVPRWHSWHTRAGYPLYAFASGGLLWWMMIAIGSPDRLIPLDRWRGLLTLVLAFAAFLKYSHWKAFAGRRSAAIDMSDALGIRGRAKLLDVGHTGPTFLTREFGYRLDPTRATLLRWIALLLAFALPALLIGWPAGGGAVIWLTGLAALSGLCGLVIERWLFFAEAEHVVMLYHGASHV